MPKIQKSPLDKPEIAEEQSVPAGSATMDSLTAGEEFPAPDEEAIAAITNKESVKNVKKSDNEFNPEIHRTNPDGSPTLTKTGKFRKKTGYKFVNPEAKKETVNGIPEISSAAAAGLTSGIIERLSVMLISEDFIYTETERAQNILAWTGCYDYYGGVNVTPPIALAIDHMAIILARANKPTTISKFKALVFWVKNKFKRKNKNGPLPDSRNDGRGQDDVGAQKSA